MNITKKHIQKTMLKCWNRGKKRKKHMSYYDSMVFEMYESEFKNIGIHFTNNKTIYGAICHEVKNNKRIFDLYISKPNIKNLVELDDVVAHELAHFIDVCNNRTTVHDLQFAHNRLLLGRSQIDMVLFLHNFEEDYCLKYKKSKKTTINTYEDLLTEKLTNIKL